MGKLNNMSRGKRFSLCLIPSYSYQCSVAHDQEGTRSRRVSPQEVWGTDDTAVLQTGECSGHKLNQGGIVE